MLHTWGEIKYIQISTHLHRCSVDSSVTTATAGLRLRAIRQIALACDLLSLLTQPERADMCSSSRLSSCLIQWTEPQSAFCYLYLNILSVPFFVAFNMMMIFTDNQGILERNQNNAKIKNSQNITLW